MFDARHHRNLCSTASLSLQLTQMELLHLPSMLWSVTPSEFFVWRVFMNPVGSFGMSLFRLIASIKSWPHSAPSSLAVLVPLPSSLVQ